MQQKLTQIEEALLRIDPATFQRLCDEYLFCRYGAGFDSQHIIRAGTQLGKMQTTKGTPDTYIVLPGGKYVLVEYTKQQTNLLKKLQDDVAKCLDSTKTGLTNKQIERIIIIHASKKLGTKEDNELRQNCLVPLEIIGLDELALSIHNDLHQLARRYLDIPYETLQIQTPEEFVDEHTRKAVGENNPLSNPLMHREEDLSTLLDKINTHDITVLTGGQGVGKTRLALEALEIFSQDNQEFESFCIANKYAPLLEDLNDLVRPKKKYIFLIDDANRQTPILLQTLGYLYAKPGIEFKIVLTVRDYALDNVIGHLKNYLWASHKINKLTDEQIIQLIAEEPFRIGNYSFQQRIRDLANGNPRLAIMAAKLALKNQDLLVLYDATDLYISYYDNLIDSDNKSLLANSNRLKVLGLLAVFRQIDLLQEAFVERLLSAFSLTRDMLASELASLERDELASVYLNDQSFFRLSDQNLATYAVYIVFIEKKLLSVEALLTEFFEDYPQRIRDAFYGVMNAFDKDRIVNDIQTVTNQYYLSVQNDDDKAFKFLKIFFIALPTEALSYLLTVNKNLNSLVEHWREKNPFWRLSDHNNEGPLKDRLQLLFNFFAGFNEYFDTALELLVEFAENSFPTVSLLASLIHNRLAFRPEDAHYNELRQARLLYHLINETQAGNKSARHLLFDVLPFFLKSEFQSTSAMRGLAVTFTTMPYPVKEPFIELRSTLWKFIDNQFAQFPDDCRSILFSSKSSYSSRDNKALRKFDKDFIITLTEKYLTEERFDDCHFVNEYVRSLNRNGLQSSETDQLALKFKNREYTLYLQLDWNRFRGRDAGDETWKEPDQYKIKKRAELQNSLHFGSLPEIEQLFDDILSLASNSVIERFALDGPLTTILCLVKNQSFELFKQTVAVFLVREWPSSVPIGHIISSVFDFEIINPDEWYTIFNGALYRRAEWLLNFFSLLPTTVITTYWADKLIRFFLDESVDGIYIYDNWWQKYLTVRPSIYQDILAILSSKYDQSGTRYLLWDDFLKERIDLFVESDMPLLKKIYLQQFEIHLSDPVFDFQRDNLKAILTHDPAFIMDFIEAHYKGYNGRFDHPNIRDLGFIWSLPNATKWVLEIVRFMKNKKRYSLHGSQYETLFQGTALEHTANIHTFLNEYVKTYKNDIREIESMVQALQHMNMYEEWILCVRVFLTYNHSVEAFKKISWAPNSLSGNGKMNFDQIRANRLKQVLEQVRQMPKKLMYLEHIKYLEWDITIHEKSAEAERRRQFGEDDY